MSRKWIYFLAAACGAVPAAIWMFLGIMESTSSTAAVGFLFLPVAGGIGALIGMFFAFSGFSILDLSRGQKDGVAWRLTVVAGVAALTMVVSWRWRTESEWLAVAESAASSKKALFEVCSRKAWLKEHKITEALAKNKNSPTEVLEDLARKEDPMLLWLVGENPATPSSLVDEIASGPVHYSSMGGVAKNPLLKREAMERFVKIGRGDFASDVEYRLWQTFVLANLVRRPDLPKELYNAIASSRDPEYFLIHALIQSPHAGCELLRKFTGHENPAMQNMVGQEMKKRGC